jgi:hypothetical protein
MSLESDAAFLTPVSESSLTQGSLRNHTKKLALVDHLKELAG